VMAKNRSTVIIVSVKIDKWAAKTVNHPAARHPQPIIM
jgi:hypothetical protein